MKTLASVIGFIFVIGLMQTPALADSPRFGGPLPNQNSTDYQNNFWNNQNADPPNDATGSHPQKHLSLKGFFSGSRPAPDPHYPAPIHSQGTFVFDPKTLSWIAYDSEGNIVKTGRASGGRNYCPDLHRSCHTPVGTFRVYAKKGGDCKSSKFPLNEGGAPMPYCNFFHGGYAVHGSYEVPGYNASHGCIRVPPDQAIWLYHNFMRFGTVIVVRPYS